MASRHSLTGEVRSNILHNMRFLENAAILDKAQIAELNHIRQVRNEIVHGQVDYKQALSKSLIDRVKHYAYVLGAYEP